MMGIDAFVDSLCSILGKAGCYVRCQYSKKSKSSYLVANIGGCLPVKIRVSDHPPSPRNPIYDFYFYPSTTQTTLKGAAEAVIMRLGVRLREKCND